MTHKITEFQKIIDEYKIQLKKLENDFAEIIKDISIPLEDRWNLFTIAPDELSESSPYLQNFEILEDVNWYDDFYIDKHQTVKLVSIIEGIEEDIKYADTPKKVAKTLKDLDGNCRSIFITDPEAISRFKEEILNLNIKQFEYDW